MTWNFHHGARTRAFTLLEVMMAATVLLMGIVGMTQVIISGSEMLDVSRKQTIAVQMIHTEIDDLHLTDWSTVNNWNGYYWNNTNSPVQIDSLSSASYFGYPELSTYQSTTKGFTIIRVLSYVSGHSNLLIKITYTVTWTGNTGRSYSRSGTTYFGKNGLSLTYRSP